MAAIAVLHYATKGQYDIMVEWFICETSRVLGFLWSQTLLRCLVIGCGSTSTVLSQAVFYHGLQDYWHTPPLTPSNPNAKELEKNWRTFRG